MSQRATRSRSLPSLVVSHPEWAPEVDARLTRVGIRIFMGADAMFFTAFFFAFFYLKALNNDHEWMPSGVVHPRRYIGGIIVLLVVACAALFVYGARVVAKSPATARLFFWLALLAGVACLGFQVYEFRHLGLDPQHGFAYPSVFVGLKAALMIHVAGALLWLGTHIHQANPTGDSVARPAPAVAFGNFLVFLAGVSLVAYLVLYFLF
jgi:heme/copper-type cytochrome/quinol oxidase subunit 3